MIQFHHVVHQGVDYLTAFFSDREPLGPVGPTHPNFKRIVAAATAALQGNPPEASEVASLFDIPKSIERAFQRLSERVTVDSDGVKVDGDVVDNTLTQQILDFLSEGEDVAPLVNFYEKVLTNPLGDVRAGLYDWIAGQRSDGSKVTIAEDGDLIGYKGVWPCTSTEGKYRPSTTGQGIVNGQVVGTGSRSRYGRDSDFIVQGVGDVVEMPRSTLSEPSHECGVGLHVGTWKYASDFGPVCMSVKFSPRDVVSAPDSNSSWKLRVCRYTVIGITEGAPLDSSVYHDDDYDLDYLDFDFD